MTDRFKTRAINIYYFFFIFVLILDVCERFVNGYAKESWQITEFLINYEGGFIRRGLLGQLLLYSYRFLGISPYFIILSICILSFLVLIFFLVKAFIRNGYSLFILPFCFLLGNPIVNDFLVRKDILLILVFGLILYFANKQNKWNYILVNLILGIALLIHEGIGFFIFPILFLYLANKNLIPNNKATLKNLLFSFLKISPSVFLFLLVLSKKGTVEISSKIWDSWKPINFPWQEIDDSQIPAAIKGISWSLEKGLSFLTRTFNNFDGNIYGPLGWFLLIISIYFILINTDKLNFQILNFKPTRTINTTNISNILIFQFISLIPLFILGWDYSRWIFYWTTSSFIILLLIPDSDLVKMFPRIIQKISFSSNSFFGAIFNTTSVLLLTLLIGFPAYSWKFSACIDTSSFFILLRFISVKIIKYFIF